MRIAIIGCGNISTTYLRLAPMFKGLDVVACADLNVEAAAAQAAEFNCAAMPVDALLASDVELIINLTVPSAHMEVSKSALQAGKHVYSEKPYVLTLAEGLELEGLAEENGLRVGSAPDTFLGGVHQKVRMLIDAGEIGTVSGGACFFMNRGMEHWHPNPDFFYQSGAGPMLDMGPYYLANLVQLLGPVERVCAVAARPSKRREILSTPRCGEFVNVEIDTSVTALLQFESGAQVSLSTSWDVQAHEHNCMELYGSGGTVFVPDPNFFGGEVRTITAANSEAMVLPVDHPFAVPNDEHEDGMMANYRGAGLADMVAAIEAGRQHRCNQSLALHVIDIMTSALASAERGEFVSLTTRCERPAVLDAAAAAALLV